MLTGPHKTAFGIPILRSKWASEWGVTGWVVLCDISEWNTPHLYVVWWLDVNGNVSGGQYCVTLDEAEATFEQRST